jgi:TolA-binding protein
MNSTERRDGVRTGRRGWTARAAALLSVGLLAVLGLAGCQRQASAPPPASGEAADGATQSQAERTKAMEQKARELDQKAADIQNMQGTEQEKIDAVNKLEQERQELNKQGEGGATPAPPQP